MPPSSKVAFILPDHAHYSSLESGYCEHCGQSLPGLAPSYGERRPNVVGVVVALVLHALLLALFLLDTKTEKKAPPPSGGEIVYVAPLGEAPKPKPVVKPNKPSKPQKPTPPPKVRRLVDTITPPEEKPKPVEPERKVEPVKPVNEPVAPDVVDMADFIARQKAKRGAPAGQPAAESAGERANRIASANIASANGKSMGDDSNDTGGVFSVTNQTSQSAEVKFRGWNPNFKRRWLQQVTVELGTEPDIETAIIKKMIELIRKEKKGDFEWDSQRLQRVVTMSARVEDTAALHAFLVKEMFPDRGGRR